MRVERNAIIHWPTMNHMPGQHLPHDGLFHLASERTRLIHALFALRTNPCGTSYVAASFGSAFSRCWGGGVWACRTSPGTKSALRCSLAPAEEAKVDINAKRAELSLRIKARELSERACADNSASRIGSLKSAIGREKASEGMPLL